MPASHPETTKSRHRRPAVLSRRKRGKTALVQRLYNILHAQNDPQIIPFYIRVGEFPISELDFARTFYQELIKQYLSYKRRTAVSGRGSLGFEALREMAGTDEFIRQDIDDMERACEQGLAAEAWQHAAYAGERISARKDERIIQIIDEFQYLNEFIYMDKYPDRKSLLCGTYQHMGSSKISPQIITGSQVGILQTIIGKMVGRYDEYELKNLSREEALEAIYNYSRLYELEVTDESAGFIAELCHDDPFYIASLFGSKQEEKDMTDREAIIRTMDYETTGTAGSISRMWYEYIHDAFGRINAINARRIVMYLANYGGEERTRQEIKEDLNLDLDDLELEQRLHQLVKADIISYGRSLFHLKGLGDTNFEIVYRKLYGPELESLTAADLEAKVYRQLRNPSGFSFTAKKDLTMNRPPFWRNMG